MSEAMARQFFNVYFAVTFIWLARSETFLFEMNYEYLVCWSWNLKVIILFTGFPSTFYFLGFVVHSCDDVNMYKAY